MPKARKGLAKNLAQVEQEKYSPAQEPKTGTATKTLRTRADAVAEFLKLKRSTKSARTQEYCTGYHDYFWFAFYDLNAGGKTKSVQLFLRMDGAAQIWRYGLALGLYCGKYFARLRMAILNSVDAVIEYVRNAPSGTVVQLWVGEQKTSLNQNQFADALVSNPLIWFGEDGELPVAAPLVHVRVHVFQSPRICFLLADPVGVFFARVPAVLVEPTILTQLCLIE